MHLSEKKRHAKVKWRALKRKMCDMINEQTAHT